MTPEGKIKQSIKKVLDAYDVYYFMPVQTGLGASGLDFHCVVRASYLTGGEWVRLPLAFFIEAKAPGKEPSERQKAFMERRKKEQGCVSIVIDGDDGLNKLAAWLENLQLEDGNEYPCTTDNIQISP